MDISTLDKKLDTALSDFSSEMRSQFSDYSKEQATEADIAELSRQVFYLVDTFRKEIISFLKSNG